MCADRSRSGLRGLGLALGLLALMGGSCGNDQDAALLDCGNGVVDGDEQCDDGNLSDLDACLSTCQPNVCGDGFRDPATEECEAFGTLPTCAQLGFGAGTVGCLGDCQLDTSGCGAQFTPTATRTTTPTAAPTNTPTPTPEEGFCGDGEVNPGETCDPGSTCVGGANDGEACTGIGGAACPGGSCRTVSTDQCPADCTILDCTPAGATQSFRITFAVDGSTVPSSINFRVLYPDGTLSLPGTANDREVRRRVTDTPRNSIVGVRDDEFALVVLISAPGEISGEQLGVIEFDTCQENPGGASADDLTCEIIQASTSSIPNVPGVTCSVTEPAG